MNRKRAEGVWRYLPVPPDPPEFDFSFKKDEDDPNLYTTGSWISDLTGTFTGKSKDLGFAIFHDAGLAIFIDTLTFESVEVDGKSGGLELYVLGSGVPGDWKGSWFITSATGDLAGLRGEGTWEGPGWEGDPEVMGEINYTGSIHFESD
jgi:hypothetical protein